MHSVIQCIGPEIFQQLRSGCGCLANVAGIRLRVPSNRNRRLVLFCLEKPCHARGVTVIVVLLGSLVGFG